MKAFAWRTSASSSGEKESAPPAEGEGRPARTSRPICAPGEQAVRAVGSTGTWREFGTQHGHYVLDPGMGRFAATPHTGSCRLPPGALRHRPTRLRRGRIVCAASAIAAFPFGFAC